MKRLVIILLFSVGTVCLYGQEFSIYVNGQKRIFEISTTKMFVKSDTLNAAQVKSEMQKKSADNTIININAR